ncbi:TrkA family potassium uptake protein [Micromonospora sp. CPCC 205371]|nr:TrkA family potassium uptake protein [Micromonospora sp. CPCC 205371]
MANIHNEPVVVLGLGRFGSALAMELVSRGTEVLGIDSSNKVVRELAGQLANVATADCTDIEALRQLGVPEFRRAVMAIGTDIQASILTTALLTDLGITDIWAKALNPRHADILRRVGAHHVVLPEQDMGERVAHLLSGRMLDYVEVDQDFAIIKAKPPRDIVGMPLRESRLRSKYGVTVVAVKSEAEGSDARFGYATADTVLMYGDHILVVGSISDLERFAEAD